MSSIQPPADVLVVGGGVAGPAAAPMLAREGHRVRCVEPSGYEQIDPLLLPGP